MVYYHLLESFPLSDEEMNKQTYETRTFGEKDEITVSAEDCKQCAERSNACSKEVLETLKACGLRVEPHPQNGLEEMYAIAEKPEDALTICKAMHKLYGDDFIGYTFAHWGEEEIVPPTAEAVIHDFVFDGCYKHPERKY